MKTIVRHPGLRQSILALALVAAFGPAHAADDDESVMEASVSAGVGVVSGDKADRAQFGQYNGLGRRDGYGLLDFDYYRRNDDTGTMTRLNGSDVLGETRELDFLWKRQGNWMFSATYGELVRRDPYTVNSGLLGAGTATPQVANLAGGAGTGLDFDLKTKRSALGLAFSKWFSPAMQLDVSLKTENKDGMRIFGRGANCPSTTAPGCGFTTGAELGWASLFVPEPIDSNHTQIEARLSYAFDKLRISGGYYGSFFNNSYGALNPAVSGTLNNALGTALPMNAGLQQILNQAVALAPDNHAHQFDLTGHYAFTRSTRASFKVAHTVAVQNQDFAAAGLTGAPVVNGAPVANLGGDVSTTLAQLAFSSRPLPKLTVNANWRYEDRNDKTPTALYGMIGGAPFASPAVYWTNRNLSYVRNRGKLEASYQFSSDYRGTLGVDYNAIDRGDFTATSAVSGLSALREKNDETGYRAELRRRMSENFSGAITVSTSKREGSNWLRPNSGTGVTEVEDPSTGFLPNAIFMPSLADRKRDKVRLMANWQATDTLGLQFSVDDGRDRFDTPTGYGLQSSKMNLFNLDMNYALSERWSLNGYVTKGRQQLNQARPAGYIMAFDNHNTTLGLGLLGKPTSDLQLGFGVSFVNDRNEYNQGLDSIANPGSADLLAATGGLPDIVYRRLELRAFGNYRITKTSFVRVDVVHQRVNFNDWAFGYDGVPYVYSDGTTLTQQQSQNATFAGVRYIHKWQ